MTDGQAIMEKEVKLTAANAATLDGVMRDPEVLAKANGASWRARTLVSTYLDTPGHALLTHKYGFRFRRLRETGEWKACLKGEGGLKDGYSVRSEWEQIVPGPVDRLSLLPEGSLRDQILSVAPGGEMLVPLVETAFVRHTLDVSLGDDSLVELALDQGEIRAGGKIFPLFEVELEQKAGRVEPMLDFADALRHRHALKASQHSKFALGLQLLHGDWGHW
ncbi:MAG: CYTH domain-containing protein [Magnetococcales bacterium]|nr:CYTH domain-containing protein [Magnetococcales bacterium]